MKKSMKLLRISMIRTMNSDSSSIIVLLEWVFVYSEFKSWWQKCCWERWSVAICIFFIFQNLRDGFTPNIKRMQTLAKPPPLHVSESGVGLLRDNSEYEMGNLRRDDSFNIWCCQGCDQMVLVMLYYVVTNVPLFNYCIFPSW